MKLINQFGWTALLALTMVAGAPSAKAQASANAGDNAVKDDLFAGTEQFAKGASSVTQIDMDPDSLNEVEGHNASRARRMVLSVVHTYEYDKPGMYNMADVDVYRKKLETGDWHCSVHTFEEKSGNSTDVCSRHRTDGLRETAIITVSPKSLTFIHTIKRPDMDDKSDLGDMIVLPGLGSLPTLAMLDPEQYVAMQAAMQTVQSLDMTKLQKQMQDVTSNLQKVQKLHPLPGVSDRELQQQMDKVQQQLRQLQAPETQVKP